MTALELPDTIVGIDVETTALDPSQGEIIEVAAIRYRLSFDQSGLLQGEAIGEYSSLTKPSQALSAEITAITGISAEMVVDKPAFAAVKDELQQFVGDSLLFAHNASFDIGFLTHYGLDLKRNPVWDTFTLAGVAWPEAESYNLGMLAEAQHISVSGEHRAGSDVRLTWQLLQKIQSRLAVSASAYEHICRLLASSREEHYLPLFSPVGRRTPPGAASPRGATNSPRKPAVQLKSRPTLTEVFSPSGPLSAALPGWQHRPEQVAMAEAVADVMRQGTIGLVEAGPGIGKTYAYLVPIIQHVLRQRERSPVAAIISTFTKNLQDQLVTRDVPTLQRALGTSLRVAALKGRRNYLCAARLQQALQQPPGRRERAWLLIKLLAWLDQGGSGDLDRLNTSHQAAHVLVHLHADALSCRTVCASVPGSVSRLDCPYQLARRAASAADIVVVNHALLMQLRGDDGALPLQHVIIDEAHHLEEAAREATRVDVSDHHLAELLAPILRLTALASQTRASIPKSASLAPLTREAKALLTDYQAVLAALAAFVATVNPSGRLRLTDSIRRHTGWQRVTTLADRLHSRHAFLAGMLASSPSGASTGLLHDASRELDHCMLDIERFIRGSAERVQWLEKGEKDFLLHDMALSVQPAISRLLHSATSVTLTSATLSVGGQFDYIKSRMGITAAATHRLASSFDYKEQMLLYCVDDSPSPAQADYDSFTAQQIISVAHLLSGRLLALFTSHDAVRSAYRQSLSGLNKGKIRLLAQGITGGRYAVSTRFRKIAASVLLGTYSFWEGIDIPGDSLSCVMISRLPFPPPDDPLLNALAEAEHKNNFNELVLPHMVLRLRQGVGRLIRSSTDRGAVIILDSRFITASYGDLVLKSLPAATVHIGSYRNLLNTLTAWFGPATLSRWRTDHPHHTVLRQ